MNHHEHERHVRAAQRHLTLALTELLTPSVDGKANAIMYASLALLDISKSDPKRLSLERVIRECEHAQSRHNG